MECGKLYGLYERKIKTGFIPVSYTHLAVLVAFVACMAIVVVNGVLVGMFKLPPFIGTLGTMTIGRGIAQIVNGNYNTGDIGQGAAETFRNIFYYGKTLGIYNGVWITIVIWIVFNYMLSSTQLSLIHIYFFYEPLGRFPTIEEDEAPYRLLCTEYPEAK